MPQDAGTQQQPPPPLSSRQLAGALPGKLLLLDYNCDKEGPTYLVALRATSLAGLYEVLHRGARGGAAANTCRLLEGVLL